MEIAQCMPACTLTAPTSIHCYPKGWAAPGEVPCQCNSWRALSKLKGTLPQWKIDVTSKSPVGDISVVTLIRTDTTLDHSQKAEKVCTNICPISICQKCYYIHCVFYGPTQLICTSAVWAYQSEDCKAKHHGCNSRIDKCCSLRLIQRHISSGPALLSRLLVRCCCLFVEFGRYPFSPAEQHMSLRLEHMFKPHQMLHSHRHPHGCKWVFRVLPWSV